jgi:hypothetical protein
MVSFTFSLVRVRRKIVHKREEQFACRAAPSGGRGSKKRHARGSRLLRLHSLFRIYFGEGCIGLCQSLAHGLDCQARNRNAQGSSCLWRNEKDDRFQFFGDRVYDANISSATGAHDRRYFSFAQHVVTVFPYRPGFVCSQHKRAHRLRSIEPVPTLRNRCSNRPAA